ncbi:MAG TPA: hypothetical protein VI299_10710 [Polyangiales bacterium]
MDLDALAPVTGLSGGLALRPPPADGARETPPVPQNPAEVLAMLMDFAGSVQLAELLHAPPVEGPGHPEAKKLATKLQREVGARLDALLPLALKPLTGRRAPTVPPPEELLEAIERACGEPGKRPDPEAALRLARELGAPLRSALGASLRQAQAHIATLRWEIAHELRGLGPRADRLERIDAALQRSVQGKLGELFDRMELAAELTFERACAHACQALPDDFGAADLVSWSAESGWIERYRERCVRMTRALFGHLRRSLEGLLRAAIHAEVV